MKLKSLLAVAFIFVIAGTATAGPFGLFGNRGQSCPNGQCPTAQAPGCTYCNPCQCPAGKCPSGCPVQSSGEYVTYNGKTYLVPPGHQLVDRGVVVYRNQSYVAPSQTTHTTSQGVTGFILPSANGCVNGKCPLVAPKSMPKLKD